MLTRRKNVVDLSGVWTFRMDPERQGIARRYYEDALEDVIELPGTTETRNKGEVNGEALTWALSRERPYTGWAWYQREFEVPPALAGKAAQLVLERSKRTTVWLGSREIGSRDTLCTSHVYELGRLEAGTYRLTVLVDNAQMPPLGGTHQLSEHTQTNWNGIIGRMELQFAEPVHVTGADIAADAATGTVRVELTCRSWLDAPVHGRLTLSASCDAEDDGAAEMSHGVELHAGETPITLELHMGRNVRTWDEYSPALYTLYVRLECEFEGERFADETETAFGFSEFAADGTRFSVNGRTVFLRGKLDNCVFPLTGHPPMETDAWLKQFETAKAYGINHYRFHSWCPPEAAFAAADAAGVYLQVELPLWANLLEPGEEGYQPGQEAYLLEEGMRIFREFGNHPSFVMFALGNELAGNPTVHARLLSRLREADGRRRLYAQGSNNFFWKPFLPEGDDFWVTMRTHGPDHMVRGSFAHADPPLGHLQTEPPATTFDYSRSIADVPVPVVGHEVGQYQVFPNVDEIAKYTGVLKPRNLEKIRDSLAERGLLPYARKFFEASGRLAVLNYRDEIETALRTPGFGGFQLLDLQDFPGQGTALVGILDAFMDSKGLIEPERWREFCSDIVLLGRMSKFTWRSDEMWTCDVDVAHYGREDLEGVALHWSLTDEDGAVVAEGRTEPADVRQGGLTRLARLSAALGSVDAARELTVTLRLTSVPIQTRYRIWVYPEPAAEPDAGDVAVCRDAREAERILRQGGKVLLIPDTDRLAHGIDGLFTSDFWCYPTFEAVCKRQNLPPAPGTLGILCDPGHPLFRGFPTRFHSDYQWWHIVTRSKAAVLDDMPMEFEPIVWVIDNFARNHKLGLVFEAHVHEGKLLVCCSDLFAIRDQPEARQLYRCLVGYMRSEAFRPRFRMEAEQLLSKFAYRAEDLPAEGKPPQTADREVPDSANILDFVDGDRQG